MACCTKSSPSWLAREVASSQKPLIVAASSKKSVSLRYILRTSALTVSLLPASPFQRAHWSTSMSSYTCPMSSQPLMPCRASPIHRSTNSREATARPGLHSVAAPAFSDIDNDCKSGTGSQKAGRGTAAPQPRRPRAAGQTRPHSAEVRKFTGLLATTEEVTLDGAFPAGLAGPPHTIGWF